MTTPDLLEPIIGYRVHRINSKFEMFGQRWTNTPACMPGVDSENPHGVNRAMCASTFRTSPEVQPMCTDMCVSRSNKTTKRLAWLACGFHAFKEIDNVVRMIMQPGHHGHYVIVKANLWGHVFEHELGYRAEYMSVKEIVALDHDVILHSPRIRLITGLCSISKEIAYKTAEHYNLPISRQVVSDELHQMFADRSKDPALKTEKMGSYVDRVSAQLREQNFEKELEFITKHLAKTDAMYQPPPSHQQETI